MADFSQVCIIRDNTSVDVEVHLIERASIIEHFESGHSDDLVVDEMYMDRVTEAHRIDEVPILCCAYLGIVAGPTLAEIVVPVKKEGEVGIAEERSHSDGIKTSGRINDGLGEILAEIVYAGKVVKGSSDLLDL